MMTTVWEEESNDDPNKTVDSAAVGRKVFCPYMGVKVDRTVASSVDV
jgi:hypothetical protein